VSDAAKPVEFTTKFSAVKFSTVPEDKRPNPESLSPEMRASYDRIAAAGGAEFVSVTKNGDLRVSGTFTQFRKDGSAKAGQAFVAYSSMTKNGNKLDFAADMIEKFPSADVVGFAKVRVVPGREDGKGGRFQDLSVLFPQTEAERVSWLAPRGQSEGQKAPAAAAAAPKGRAADYEFPFSVDFTVKFSDVEFSTVPEDKRPNPESLSPEMRASYDRIAAARGTKFVSVTEKGDLCVSGTFILIRKNGPIKVGQGFVAYSSMMENGNKIDFAADMIEKFRSLDDVGFAKARAVLIRKDDKGRPIQDFIVSFPQTEAERASWLASRGDSEGQKAPAAAAAAPKGRAADDEIPF